MLKTVLLLFTGCVLVVQSVKQPNRVITKTLMLNNGLDWGKQGDQELCPEGSFAQDVEVKFEDYSLLDSDETALNGIKLYCATVDGHHTAYIKSTEGEKGEWKGLRTCPTGFMTGMRAMVLESQGVLGDDVAVQKIEMDCNYGDSVVPGMVDSENIKDGEWSMWTKCDDGSAICGIQIRYESVDLITDDTAVDNIVMLCCALEGSTLQLNQS